jgi:two-component system, NtrC family, sensor kinase
VIPRSRSATPAAPAAPGAHRGRWSLTTGHRLFLAFSALIGAVVFVLFFAFSGLRNIESGLDKMRKHEDQMRLSLELGNAVRDQYTHPAHLASGKGEHPVEYREARRRALDAARRLRGEHVEDPEAVGWIGDIERASDELDGILGESASARAEPMERGHALASMMEDRLDRLVARQRDATVQLRNQVSALQRSTLRWIVGFLLGAPLFATALGLYIRRSVTRPVARLGEGAARLARGDLDTRIEIETQDEFGILAAQFNGMVSSLRRHQEKLVQGEKLASVGRLAAGVAHELNNPLSVILGYLMIHRRKAGGRLAKDLWVIEQEAVRCKEIVQDLLELSRPASAAGRLAVDMRVLCDEVVSALRESGQLASCQVTVEGAGTARGNRERLRQVVVNLVKNAAEAAGGEGRVGVRVAASADVVEVAVSDSGPGIPPASRARIFEPFFTTKAAGTGLGLAVSLGIARAHGGEITIGQGEAGGARFSLRVPCGTEGEA